MKRDSHMLVQILIAAINSASTLFESAEEEKEKTQAEKQEIIDEAVGDCSSFQLDNFLSLIRLALPVDLPTGPAMTPSGITTDEVLRILESTVKMIAGDYPNANPEYKRSSFVIGAQDMAEMFVKDLPSHEKIAFARGVDNIRNKYFPTPESKQRR